MCVKQSSLADCSSYINEDWMRNSRVGEAEKKTGTMDAWVTEQIFLKIMSFDAEPSSVHKMVV